MSGHSKWSTIKRKKGEKDGARAKVFTKIRENMASVSCLRQKVTGLMRHTAATRS